MANGVQRRRRPAQKGVQAIFTPDGNWKGKAQFIAGLFGVGAGALLLLWPIQALGLGVTAIQLNTVSSSLILVPASLLLVTGGAGLCTYLLVERRTRKEYHKIESAINKLETMIGSKEGMPAPSPTTRPDVKLSEGHTSPVRISKSLAVALVEGVLLILLYGGLVAEYKSNIHMQEWVRANIAFGGYFLNEVAILLQAAALSGVLVFQWLHRRTRFKTTRRK